MARLRLWLPQIVVVINPGYVQIGTRGLYVQLVCVISGSH